MSVENPLSGAPRIHDCREEGLTARRRHGRKRALGLRALKAAERPHDIWIWVLDFMSDVLESGRRFRVFAVEDQMTRTGLAAEVDTSLPGGRVVRVLDSLVAKHGKPMMIVSDNGTELTCNAVLKWAEDHAASVALDLAARRWMDPGADGPRRRSAALARTLGRDHAGLGPRAYADRRGPSPAGPGGRGAR